MLYLLRLNVPARMGTEGHSWPLLTASDNSRRTSRLGETRKLGKLKHEVLLTFILQLQPTFPALMVRSGCQEGGALQS